MCQGFLPQEFKAIKQSQVCDFRQQRKVLFWRAVGGRGDSAEAVCSGKGGYTLESHGVFTCFFSRLATIIFFFFSMLLFKNNFFKLENNCFTILY